MPTPSTRRLVFLLFFLSGACGLVYQVAWTRMMTLVFGVSVYAVATVLCAFMAGLALGSAVFGRVADRAKNPLAIYGALEIGIGVMAALFPLVNRALEPVFVFIYRNFYVNYQVFSLARFAVVFAALLPPTFLMGGTFPLLSRHFVRGGGTMGRDLGFLYGVNTSGAVAGTLAVGFVLLASLGSNGSIWLAAAANIAVGAAAIALARRAGDLPPAEAPAEPAPATEPAFAGDISVRAPRTILITMGVSGFAALGLEILWTRMLVFHTHNSTYAFSAMLAIFLLGLALGSWAFGAVAPRIKRPLGWLAGLFMAIAVWSALTPRFAAALPPIAESLAKSISFNDWREAMILILAQSAAILLPPTFLMGLTFPLATRLVVGGGGGGLGRIVGNVYAVNTLGSILGSFVVGFVLIPVAGVRDATLVMATLYFCSGLALAAAELGGASRTLRMSGAALIAFVFATHYFVPPWTLFASFRERLGEILFYKEEVTDTIMVIDLKGDSGKPSKDFRTLVFADGRGTAGHWTVMEDRFYGHLPMLLHPDPQDVLVICVGAGNTIGAISQHQRLKSLDAVELSAGVPEAAQFFETNTGVFHKRQDPRIHLHIEDGRNYLLGAEKKYDIIHLDPPELHTAGVVFLYTEEFYELCKARLKPGGMMSHWFNATKMTDEELRQIVGTFKKAFPHGTIWQGPSLYSWNLIATDAPLKADYGRARAIIDGEPLVKSSLAEVKIDDPALLFSYLLMGEETLGKYTAGAKIITDNKTMIDFSNPKQGTSGYGFANILSATRTLLKESKTGYENLAVLTQKTDSPGPIIDWTGAPESEREGLAKRVEENVEKRRAAVKEFLPKRQGER